MNISFWFCSQPDDGHTLAETRTWCFMINKLFCIYCISDQYTVKHKQSWTKSSRNRMSLIWKLACGGEWGFRKERKKMGQTNTQWVYAATAKPNNTAWNTVILKEALSEIFFYYDQMCYPTTRTDTVNKMMVYSPVQPPDKTQSPKQLYCFSFTHFLNV